MKDKNSKSSISISPNVKDEPYSKRKKSESKNKDGNSKNNNRVDSGNDILHSILNEPKKSSGAG